MKNLNLRALEEFLKVHLLISNHLKPLWRYQRLQKYKNSPKSKKVKLSKRRRRNSKLNQAILQMNLTKVVKKNKRRLKTPTKVSSRKSIEKDEGQAAKVLPLPLPLLHLKNNHLLKDLIKRKQLIKQ